MVCHCSINIRYYSMMRLKEDTGCIHCTELRDNRCIDDDDDVAYCNDRGNSDADYSDDDYLKWGFNLWVSLIIWLTHRVK